MKRSIIKNYRNGELIVVPCPTMLFRQASGKNTSPLASELKDIQMKYIFFFIAIIMVSVCVGQYKPVIPEINTDNLKQTTKEFSSDYYQGRKPFTLGEKRAIKYLKEQFQKIGLEPGNGKSYFQPVPMMETKITHTSDMVFVSAKEKFNLKYIQDFVLMPQTSKPVIDLDDEVIFAGYGVVAPEYNWNDYAGIDVKNKIVLVLVNDPGFGTNDSTLFKGKTMTYYGRWSYKFEEAARQGAKACFVIHNTAAAAYPFSVVQNSNNGDELYLDERNNPQPHIQLAGWVSASAAKKILAAAGKDSSLIVSANYRNFKSLDLGIKLSLNATVASHYSTSQNVLGKITGTKRPNEFIIYTAHWDHLGIGIPNEEGDSIYNGAHDNATGIAGLIELARNFKKLKVKPERSILFLAVTAEEQGLLGSKYYAKSPVYPLRKTVANINMDAMNVYDKTKDIYVGGAGQNELEDYVAEAAPLLGRYVRKGGHDTGGGYFRSDHFSFVKMGVPALVAGSGSDVAKERKEQMGRNGQYMGSNYHKPTDEFNPDWTFEGAAEDLKLYFLIGHKLSMENKWPAWKAGSEFKAIREQSR